MVVSNTAFAQEKVSLKNATDCPVVVNIRFFNTSTGAFEDAVFGVAPQSYGSIAILQNQVVCHIRGDYNMDGSDEIKYFNNTYGFPNNSAFNQCLATSVISVDECYEGHQVSEEVGSYYFSFWSNN